MELANAARALHCTPGWLRKITEQAIRTHHREAFIKHVADMTHRPPIHCLRLGRRKSFRAYFTVERNTIVVRGYVWHIARDSQDEYDGGCVIWSSCPLGPIHL